MTIAEACAALVEMTREVSSVRAERDAHRLVAYSAVHHCRELYVELEALKARYYRLIEERRQERRAA